MNRMPRFIGEFTVGVMNKDQFDPSLLGVKNVQPREHISLKKIM